jgi:hypothetical protein
VVEEQQPSLTPEVLNVNVPAQSSTLSLRASDLDVKEETPAMTPMAVLPSDDKDHVPDTAITTSKPPEKPKLIIHAGRAKMYVHGEHAYAGREDSMSLTHFPSLRLCSGTSSL